MQVCSHSPSAWRLPLQSSIPSPYPTLRLGSLLGYSYGTVATGTGSVMSLKSEVTLLIETRHMLLQLKAAWSDG